MVRLCSQNILSGCHNNVNMGDSCKRAKTRFAPDTLHHVWSRGRGTARRAQDHATTGVEFNPGGDANNVRAGHAVPLKHLGSA